MLKPRWQGNAGNHTMQKSQFSWIGIILLTAAVSFGKASSDAPPHGPRIVMIIRHAEKPDDSDGSKDPNLSKQGFARADALAKVIPDHFVKPDFLIATKKSKGSNRPVETITPLSKAIHEEIESNFKDEEFEQAAHEVLTDSKFDGKVVLIAWHHGKIPELAKALGVKDCPDKWNSAVFDRVWQITYENGVPSWKDLPQKALPGDAEK
jgi:phosphohistidine phosphatase SixA